MKTIKRIFWWLYRLVTPKKRGVSTTYATKIVNPNYFGTITVLPPVDSDRVKIIHEGRPTFKKGSK